ncbi:hypothetical protein [Rhizomonospora bruguierae]|uniref:hypothetical protein n=1 Tax=Rhizomonospora bruguierae TaxID=1581705 RepID=UPI001BD162E2|nr:hypothetical protein [Micromonospora sp. NBRC 107566]
MTADLLVLSVCAAWTGAALLAGALPQTRTACALRRRTRWLSALVAAGGTGVVLVLAAGAATGVTGARALLLGAPAALAGATAFALLARVRSYADAFTTAPAAPASPGLRAAAARPLLAAPIQVTALAAFGVAASTLGPHPLVGLGVAGTLVAAAGLATAIGHSVRHSILAEGALRLAPARVAIRPLSR